MKQQLNFLEPIELQTRTPTGNTQLVEYGITKENSDYRVHIGYLAQHIYIFPTNAGRLAITDNLERKKVSLDGRIVTASGYAVPISAIDGIVSVLIPYDIYHQYRIYEDMPTSTKGLLAVQITVEMLKRQLIPLPVNIDIKNDSDLQIKGTDIIIHSELRLQVKCDYKAGEKKYGGTGNLFLQTHECNPYKLG